MMQIVASLDAKTMVLMVSVLYFSLTMVMVYTFYCRQTYPGFGSLALGQLSWSLGIFLIFYRLLGENASIVIGNILLFLHGVCWYHGIVLYGGMDAIRRRNSINIGIALIALGVIVYYIYIDFNSCRRVVVFSVFEAFLYGRIALEPYLVKRWRTYPMQSVFSTILLIVALAFALRGQSALHAANCGIGGPDSIVKTLLLASMFLLSLLTFCLLSMTSSRVEAELREARDALRHLAETDALTGLPNRRHFLRQAEAALTLVREQGGLVSLIMLDLDHFKDINDTHGHLAGDMVLGAVGRRLRTLLREKDVIGRLGGEEFGILVPDMPGPEAVAVARRLCAAVAALRPGGYAVTASLGVATGLQELDALLARADEGMYAAKAAGRNRVVCLDGLAAVRQEALA